MITADRILTRFPFAGVLEPLRADLTIATAGMTTARWKEILPDYVAFENLWLIQSHLSITKLFGIPDESSADDLFPHVVVYKGRSILEDGHHRVTRYALNGLYACNARVLRVTDEALSG